LHYKILFKKIFNRISKKL